MDTIRLLNEEVISKIAAGEVIERPAYAVKELIENALDAGATAIRIDIEKAGLQKITVSDNGLGMSKEDLEQSFKPHTTSKIFHKNDLVGIRSLGFRGEALSSIAAVSYLSIQSRKKNAKVGNEVAIENGKTARIKPVGMAQGTKVTVEELFHSVPARKNFLKSLQIEFRYILQIVTQYALAFPKIRFFLTHNKKTVLNLSENQSSEERIESLLGEEVYQYIVPVQNEELHVRVSGFISKPQIAQSSTQKQFIFINGRSIKNKSISSIIKDTYGTLLTPENYPVFILFLELPYDLVDVNVHPRKEEVNFYNESVLKQSIVKAVEESLVKHNLAFHDERWKRAVYRPQIGRHSLIREGATKTYAADLLKEQKLPWELQKTEIKDAADVVQIHKLYLVVQTNKGVVIFDQHAVHERILFEQYEERFITRKKSAAFIRLKEPIHLKLSITEKQIITESVDILENLGMKIKNTKNSFSVTDVFILIKDRNIQEIVTEILNDISEEKEISIDSRSKRMLAYLACRAAVKAGDKLTKEQCKDLIKQLNKVKNPYTCPHGRPLKIEIELQDLHKLFRRT
ncbi:MAG: DNA mismatch repair endonuclease MutL [Patescibacteria group bacterium]